VSERVSCRGRPGGPKHGRDPRRQSEAVQGGRGVRLHRRTGPPADDGSFVFSDPNRNTVYRYAAEGTLSVRCTPSGYEGGDVADYKQPGSNGLALDDRGRLTIDEHGNRRVSRLEPDGQTTVLADRFDGRRLNSPNWCIDRTAPCSSPIRPSGCRRRSTNRRRSGRSAGSTPSSPDRDVW
jgi:hypothetical protein